jgi:endonuclease/exonuclease/phosphatase family metal-dependent hydrolase
VIRVLTWNLRHLRDDRAAVVRVVRAAAPDVMCIQEGPRSPLLSGWSLRRLARDVGLRVVAGGWPAAGNAVLHGDRIRVADAVAIRFPRTALSVSRRGSVMVTVRRDGAEPVRLACVHLGLLSGERLAHAAALVTRLRASGLPVVVAGDLNESPGGPSWQALGAVVNDPAPGAPVTFSAESPRRRIDAILTSAGVETLEYARWQPDPGDARRASDHLPVLSIVRPKG